MGEILKKEFIFKNLYIIIYVQISSVNFYFMILQTSAIF